MKKIVSILTLFSMLSQVGCFKPSEKGIKGQAYLAFEDYNKGQALVDLPIYCYSSELFELSLDSMKASLSADLSIIGEHNAKLKADWAEAENTYLDEVKVFLKDIFEEEKKIINKDIANLNLDIAQSIASKKIQEQQSKISSVTKEIKELEAQQLATREVTEVLSSFIAEQRLLLDQGYANIEAEIISANDLIEKINKVIVDKNIALSRYEKFDLDVRRNYTNIKSCWNHPSYLRYPPRMSSPLGENRYDFFSYEKSKEPQGRVVFHTHHQSLVSRLPAELTPYLRYEISDAFYKHNILASAQLDQINSKLKESAKNADRSLLVYANKKRISVEQIKSIIKDSLEPAAFDRQILAKKSSLESFENFDISSAVASEISDLSDTLFADKILIDNCIILIDEADDFDMLYEEFRQMPQSTNLVGDSLNLYRFEKYLEVQGFKRPRRPNYASIDKRELYEEIIVGICSWSNLIVHTDFNGEFIIPEEMTRYFAYIEDDDGGVYWTASISETTDKIIIAPSSITTRNPVHLLFSQSELEELLSLNLIKIQ